MGFGGEGGVPPGLPGSATVVPPLLPRRVAVLDQPGIMLTTPVRTALFWPDRKTVCDDGGGASAAFALNVGVLSGSLPVSAVEAGGGCGFG